MCFSINYTYDWNKIDETNKSSLFTLVSKHKKSFDELIISTQTLHLAHHHSVYFSHCQSYVNILETIPKITSSHKWLKTKLTISCLALFTISSEGWHWKRKHSQQYVCSIKLSFYSKQALHQCPPSLTGLNSECL